MERGSRLVVVRWLGAVVVLLLLAGAFLPAVGVRAGDEEVPDEPGVTPPITLQIDVWDEQYTGVAFCFRIDPPAGDPIEGCSVRGGTANVRVEAPGSYLVTLTSVPDGCAIVTANPQGFDLAGPEEDVVEFPYVSFTVDCGTLPDPAAGPVTVDAYVCEDAARAGEVDFLVGGSGFFGADATCRLAADGEQSFRLTPLGDRPAQDGSTDGTGRVQFADVPFGEFTVTEIGTGATSPSFAFNPPVPQVPGDPAQAFVVIAVTYVAGVPTPTPIAGDAPGSIEVVVLTCFDPERSGGYEVFIGGMTEAASDSDRCNELQPGFRLESSALPEPLEVERGQSVAGDLPPGDYTAIAGDSGAVSPSFSLPSDGFVRITFVVYQGAGGGLVTLRKLFCADPARAGTTDFLSVDGAPWPGDGDDEVEDGDASLASVGATSPDCRPAGRNEVAFTLTRASDGRQWSKGTDEGGNVWWVEVTAGVTYTLAEEQTGAVSAPFTLDAPRSLLVVNWVAGVDVVPPAPGPGYEESFLRMESLSCVDPARAGQADVLVTSNGGDLVGESAALDFTTCVRDVGAGFRVEPDGADPFVVYGDGCGCWEEFLPAGAYAVAQLGSDARTPLLDLVDGATTHVTFVHWVESAPERALLTIVAWDCPIEEFRPFGDCGDEPAVGRRFTVGGETRATDADGYVVFGPPAGDVTITQDPASLKRAAALYVACFLDDGFEGEGDDGGEVDPIFDGRADDGSVTVRLAPDDAVVCVFVTLTGERAGTPTPSPAAGGGGRDGVTTLPNTGAGESARPWPQMFALLAALAGTASIAAVAGARRRELRPTIDPAEPGTDRKCATTSTGGSCP